jgi:hypothetical protein
MPACAPEESDEEAGGVVDECDEEAVCVVAEVREGRLDEDVAADDSPVLAGTVRPKVEPGAICPIPAVFVVYTVSRNADEAHP